MKAILSVVCFALLVGFSAGLAQANEPAAQSTSVADYFAKINSGWPQQLQGIRTQLRPDRSYVTILTIAPSTKLDLRSAEHFRQTIAHASNLKIGHMMFGWSCRGPQARVEGFTGMTGEETGQISRMIESGWGMTALVSTFTDGSLQSPAVIDYRLSPLPKIPGAKTYLVALEVDDNECLSVPRAVLNFLASPKAPSTRFGLALDPYRKEGAACVSFADYSISKVPRLSEPFKTMWRSLRFSKGIFARGKALPENTQLPSGELVKIVDKPIDRLSLMLRSWAPKSQADTVQVRLLDPEMFILFVNSLSSNKDFQRVDAGFDEIAANVSRAAERMKTDALSIEDVSQGIVKGVIVHSRQ